MIIVHVLNSYSLSVLGDGTMKDVIYFDRLSSQYSEALPVGNGRLGAMVTGSINQKIIYLNEETVWYGGPRDRNNPDALGHMGEIRRLVKERKIPLAERLAQLVLTGVPESQRHYSTLGMVVLEFPEFNGNAEEYSHALDLEKATVLTSYKLNGIDYRIRVFASTPDQVIAIRIEADAPVLNFYAGIERGERVPQFSYGTHMDEVVRHNGHGLVMRGVCGGKTGLNFRGCLFGESNGKLKILGDKIVISDASAATLYVSGGTDFADPDIENTCIKLCESALHKGYIAIYQEHLKEWTPVYQRCNIQLSHLAELDTPPAMNRVFEYFEKEDKGLITNGPGSVDSLINIKDQQELEDCLILLLFKFGRYLLASSSRNCLLPASLQGIWCRDLLSIWDGKFTTNINLEMAYWPADSTNLSECFDAYFRLALRLLENGRITARKMYNCRGFVVHNNTDIWADTAVQDAGTHCSYWFSGGVWIALDMWEHYRYTCDVNFLKEAWPLLHDAARFVLDFMEEEDGELVMGVTSSPENFYYTEAGEKVSFCRMTAMDSQLIEMLFDACIQGLEVLKAEDASTEWCTVDFEQELKIARKKLRTTKIGSDGTILEWGFEAREAEPAHRHQSHLIGAYPYNGITEKKPELWEAVKASINKRIKNGGCNTGWSRAWGAGLLARLKEADRAREMIFNMVRYSCQPNLMSCCNINRTPKLMENAMPMQMDGNMGCVQAVAELLLQSYDDEIVLLPALPQGWRDGRFQGLRARGGAVVDAQWKDYKLLNAIITASADRMLVIKTGEGYCMEGPCGTCNDAGGYFRFKAVKGGCYHIFRTDETVS